MRYKFTGRDGQIGFGDSNHEAVSAIGNDDTVAFKQRPDGRIAVWALIGHIDPVIKQAPIRGVNSVTVPLQDSQVFDD
jgi:hypothetical protein